MKIDGNLKPTNNIYVAKICANGTIFDLKTKEELANKLIPSSIASKTGINLHPREYKRASMSFDTVTSILKRPKPAVFQQKSTPRSQTSSTVRERSLPGLKKLDTNKKHIKNDDKSKQDTSPDTPESPIQTRNRSKTETSTSENAPQTRNRSNTDTSKSKPTVETDRQPRTRSHTPAKTRKDLDFIRYKQTPKGLKLPDHHDVIGILKTNNPTTTKHRSFMYPNRVFVASIGESVKETRFTRVHKRLD